MQCVFILLAFTCYPILHQNQPPRESIFCGKVGDWWAKRALIMLKFTPKTRQKKTIMPHTCAWLTARKARTLTTAGESGCRACCSQPTETTSWKHRSNLPLTTSFATYRECITPPNRPLNRLSNILSCFPLFSVLLSLACRLLTCLILLT